MVLRFNLNSNIYLLNKKSIIVFDTKSQKEICKSNNETTSANISNLTQCKYKVLNLWNKIEEIWIKLKSELIFYLKKNKQIKKPFLSFWCMFVFGSATFAFSSLVLRRIFPTSSRFFWILNCTGPRIFNGIRRDLLRCRRCCLFSVNEK